MKGWENPREEATPFEEEIIFEEEHSEERDPFHNRNRSEKKFPFPDEKTINEMMGKFKMVNLFYERLYSNKTQREALKRILRKITTEELEWILKYLSRNFGKPYLPVITTPLTLEEKFSELLWLVKAERIKKKMETPL